jgi:hypothetical protein
MNNELRENAVKSLMGNPNLRKCTGIITGSPRSELVVKLFPSQRRPNSAYRKHM